jgi:hydrogenase maturation protease
MSGPDGDAIDGGGGWWRPEGLHPSKAARRALIAGVGNLFFGDDGFGPEVARRLAELALPDGVRAADFGIRGVHLAYELSSGWERAIVVDAVQRGGAPGTLYLIAPDEVPPAPAAPDAHGLDVAAVLALAATLGALPGELVVLGCEAGALDDGIGLSAPVARAVDEAVAKVRAMVEAARTGRAGARAEEVR